MGKRRDGREAAVQYLYFRDLNQGPHSGSIEDFWDLRPSTSGIREFATELAQGVLLHQSEIDERIEYYAQNYSLNRISAVDRNILRLATFEMLFRDDIPPVVSINEAIEIARKYGTEESGRFVNGILDRIKLDLTRSAREPNVRPRQSDNADASDASAPSDS